MRAATGIASSRTEWTMRPFKLLLLSYMSRYLGRSAVICLWMCWLEGLSALIAEYTTSVLSQGLQRSLRSGYRNQETLRSLLFLEMLNPIKYHVCGCTHSGTKACARRGPHQPWLISVCALIFNLQSWLQCNWLGQKTLIKILNRWG